MKQIMIMFPGQGAQTVGMLRELYDEYSEIRDTFAEAEQILRRNICDMIWNGPQQELDLTCNTQPLMLTAEVAIFRVLRKERIEPYMLTGFSLGEWTAAVVAGMIPFAVALRLVCLRAEAMQEAVPVGRGGMAVIMGRSKDEVGKLCASCAGYVVPANYNYPGQITVSGTSEAIAELNARAESEGFVFQALPVSIPSHCELMTPAAERLKEALMDVELQNAYWPILLNASNRETVSGPEMKQNLVDQMTRAIRFEQSVRIALRAGTDTFLEAGPGKTLAGFVRKTAKALGVSVVSNRVDTKKDLKAAFDLVRR